ncbi:hypothetical protein OG233_05175 [Streptomyces sp. NBC_01218]|uniref:hypothetical protein n=1 Tax=unclassified Streptomyces TaxID=2593676 RepID=UPI0023B88940|nr:MULTISPECIES: hypothetical protein [unclassified Streptomyces]WEH38950.1 hypothetical protein PZB77_05185 [Streptomyces sp. AM 2-1-1]WSQ50611.1 hypothetical protein OG233_05175 [Streptomyces sp. NBC_01218]
MMSPDGIGVLLRMIRERADRFSSMENLVKTLGHERMHVMQIGVYGPSSSSAQEHVWEKAAYASEDQFWNYFNGSAGWWPIEKRGCGRSENL